MIDKLLRRCGYVRESVLVGGKNPTTRRTRRRTGWTLGDCRAAGHMLSGNDDTEMCWDSSHEDGPLNFGGA